MEPFRTLINESNYLNDFLQFQIIKTEEQKMLDSHFNEFLLMKIVIEDLNYTQSYNDISSEDYLDLEARIRNGVLIFQKKNERLICTCGTENLKNPGKKKPRKIK